MAWTKEVKEKRVSDRRTELANAEKRLEAFDAERKKLTERLDELTDLEKAKRAQRVANARRELEWAEAAPVDGEDAPMDTETL